MNRFHAFMGLMLLALSYPAFAAGQTLKPRVVVLTDVSTWETDDSESLVRLLAHADLLEIEGLIYTTGWSLDATRDEFIELIHDAIDAYEHDLPNLRRRSRQSEPLADETRQSIGYWPSPRSLRHHTVFGSKKRGVSHLGEGNDSPGSRLIIDLADEDDDRPLWITLWGGGNTLAQAIWRVQQERTPEQLRAFLGKLRVYAITDQDRDQNTPLSDSSHQWMRREFAEQLLFVWDECAWKYQNGVGKRNWREYEAHIQNHGHLGQVYPKFKYGVEGDTPSFLYLLPIGLNDPNVPTQGSWGGYFSRRECKDTATWCFQNDTGPEQAKCRRLMDHFYQSAFNNFAARMDWAKDGIGNRNPIVVIDGDQSLEVLLRKPRAETVLTLDASKSFDPDGDKLRFRYWVASEAGTWDGTLVIDSDTTGKAAIHLPADSAGKEIHVICEVTDDGNHHLTSYRRIIVKPTN